MKSRILALLAAGLMIGPVAASGAIVFSNLDAGDSFDQDYYHYQAATETRGFQFTASSTGFVTSMDAAIERSQSTPPDVTVTLSLYTNTNTDTLGSWLETFSITATGIEPSPTLASAVLSGTTQLIAGEKYWIVGTASSAAWRWNRNSIKDTGWAVHDGTYYNSEYQPIGAFRLNGIAPVPLPAAAWLLLSGLGGLGLLRRRKAR